MKKYTEAVTAKVAYPVIWDLNDGCYIWVTPDSTSTLSLLGLLKNAPFKTKDGTELHCTVLYTKGKLPSYTEVDFPEDRVWDAEVIGVNHWIDHKDRNILVFALASQDLNMLHEAIINQGLVHSYPEYNPHISFAKELEMNAAQRVWLFEINERLQERPLHISFSPELKGTNIN